MNTGRELPGWLRGVLVGGTIATLLYFERKRPLRQQRHSKLRRNLRNGVMAGLSGAAISLAELPVVLPLSQLVERRRWGLLQRIPLPPVAQTLLAVVLMDYTLFVWHYLTHKVPFLWRFHEAHHVDLDLDASTAVRFHFGEMLLSVPWRAAQVLLIGVSPLALSLWQTATTVEILFHHANVALPLGLERRLSRIIVTPRMHGIHHSTVKAETDSNWSTIFSFPDRLHRTMRLDVPQSAITIGVPAYQNPIEVTLGKVLALPFRRRLWQWLRPGQPAPERMRLTGAETEMAK